ncbi:MAG: anti-sigma factor [Acidimicrobiia bacterium]|nr:anti-sigma factor [Acidimicrobiia bacterium]
MSHREIEELLGAYALDAVEGPEADSVDAHLRECPRCRAEVTDLRAVAALLAGAGGPAPAGVWERIAGSLDEAPPPLQLKRVPTARRRRRAVAFVAAAAGIAAVLIAVLALTVVDQGHRIDHLAQPTARAGLAQAAAAAALDPSAHRVQLRTASGAVLADAVVLPDGTGYLLRQSLPALAPGRTYQLWGLAGTSKLSAGVFGPRPGVVGFHVSPEAWGLAITDEQAPGAETTANPPVVVGRVA